MKKIFILLCAFLFLGCSDNNRYKTLDIKAIGFLHYNNVILVEDQLLDIRGIINNINFTNNVIDDNYKDYIYVITNESILEIFVSSNNNMLLIDNGVRYYSNDVKQISSLMTYLQNIQELYTDTNFYTIESINDYVYRPNDLYIDINEIEHYIVIKSQVNIFNFNISTAEINNGEIININTLYSNEFISKDKRIVIRINKPVNIANYRINFDTPFGYNISILSYYNINNEKIEFTRTFKQKEAP